MKETKLTFRFHDPNAEAVTVNIFLQAVLKANEKNIENTILHTISHEEKQRSKIGKISASAASL